MKSALTTNHERDDVIAWRHTQPLRSVSPRRNGAGAPEVERYDLPVHIELLDRGCPPELALRILAPLEDGEAP